MVPFHVLHLVSGINFLFLPTSFQSLTALHLITRVLHLSVTSSIYTYLPFSLSRSTGTCFTNPFDR